MIYIIYTSENTPMPNRSCQSRSAKGPAHPQAGLCPTRAKLPPQGPTARLAPTPWLRPTARVAPGTHVPCEPGRQVSGFHLPVLAKTPTGALLLEKFKILPADDISEQGSQQTSIFIYFPYQQLLFFLFPFLIIESFCFKKLSCSQGEKNIKRAFC